LRGDRELSNQANLSEVEVEEVSFLDFETVDEFDSCESGFLAKKYKLISWLLS